MSKIVVIGKKQLPLSCVAFLWLESNRLAMIDRIVRIPSMFRHQKRWKPPMDYLSRCLDFISSTKWIILCTVHAHPTISVEQIDLFSARCCFLSPCPNIPRSNWSNSARLSAVHSSVTQRKRELATPVCRSTFDVFVWKELRDASYLLHNFTKSAWKLASF